LGIFRKEVESIRIAMLEVACQGRSSGEEEIGSQGASGDAGKDLALEWR